MKICFTGNVFPFGEKMCYGGERVLYYLLQGLSGLGHQIHLYAREGCSVPMGYVKEYYPVAPLNNDVDVHYEAVKESGLDFDIYQCNYFGEGWDPEVLTKFPYAELVWNCWCHVGHQLKQPPFNVVSCSKTLQDEFKRISMDTSMIHFGIPKHLYDFQPKSKGYAVWIGKIEAGKAPRLAIEVALAAGLDIVIMGPPYNTGCFYEQVAPYLNNGKVFWVRGVNDAQKYEIMSEAKVFISSNDNTWMEHFGIVNIEAMAMGVPILGFSKIGQECAVHVDGLIEHEKTGFVLSYLDSNDVDSIVDAGVSWLSKIDQIDRGYCREVFEKKFTSELMAERYTYLYSKVLDGSKFGNLEIPF